ncbi:MAG: acetyl-CoA carboxylase biotin carboxyl carrier protein [Phycisphaeraceae bacterium]|nr:acetyl-CoA carboxylase biotin carboxyl carrier protein [Phycisphaeraceae bacterium]
MIDLKTLRSLIKLMVDNNLTEVDLEGEGEKVKLCRGCSERGATIVAPSLSALPAVAMPAVVPAAAPVAVAAAPGSAGGAPASADPSLVPIKSPMVGTFYAASSPDTEPFVKIGSRVDQETVVCVLEAMKVFNEIKAEAAGVITQVLVQNGQAVEFGQPLFLIKP